MGNQKKRFRNTAYNDSNVLGCQAEAGPEEDEGPAPRRPAARREEPERWNQQGHPQTAQESGA